jgi:hypothetical protein
MATVTAAESVCIEPLAAEAVRHLISPQPGPCLSLYLPTHRNVPDNTVDRPAFRHLVESLEEALALSYSRGEIEHLLRPFHLLADDPHFWEHVRDGLGVLGGGGKAHVILLPRPVPPLAVVTPRFHTLPLLRLVAAIERFNVLTLTSREARVYEGVFAGADATPRRLELLPLGNGSAAAGLISRADAVTPEIIQPHRVQLGMGPTGKSDTRYVHGGFRAKQDDMDIDTEIFFRHVDELVHETISRQTELPLVLVALPELAAVFRGLSKNRMLLADYVPHDPALFSADDLATRVMPIFDAARQRRIAHAVRLFEQAHDRGLAATDLADVARAAVAGKVATLLIEADRFETGRLDRGTGAIEFNGEHPGDLSRTGDQPAVQQEDLYGAVAEEVLLHGGGILALDRIAMPTASGIAAIYRYR